MDRVYARSYLLKLYLLTAILQDYHDWYTVNNSDYLSEDF